MEMSMILIWAKAQMFFATPAWLKPFRQGFPQIGICYIIR